MLIPQQRPKPGHLREGDRYGRTMRARPLWFGDSAGETGPPGGERMMLVHVVTMG